MLPFIWRITLVYCMINVLCCIAEIDHGRSNGLKGERNSFPSGYHRLPLRNKMTAIQHKLAELHPPKTETMDHLKWHGRLDRKPLHKRPVHLTPQVSVEERHKYLTGKKRQKRWTSSADIHLRNVTTSLFTSLNETQKKLDQFSNQLFKIQQIRNETNQQLNEHFIPRLESIEKQLNIQIEPMKSYNCTGKREDRFNTLAQIWQELHKDAKRSLPKFTDWIRMLIYCKIPIHDKYGQKNETLLHLAAETDAVEAARLLIEKGANKEARTSAGKTPLHLAARNNSIQVLDVLTEANVNIDARDTLNRTALFEAAETDAVEAAQILIGSQADIEAEDVQKKYPIHIAANKNAIQVLQLLIGHRSPVNPSSQVGTPLQAAASSNAVDAARILLDSGAKVTATDRFGGIALHTAVTANSLRIMHLLIQYKSPLNFQNAVGYTALHWAAQKNNLQATQILVENGADMNSKTIFDWTPLHLAAQYKAEDVLEYLLENKADIHAKDFKEKSAYDMARQNGCSHCMVILEQFGAKV